VRHVRKLGLQHDRHANLANISATLYDVPFSENIREIPTIFIKLEHKMATFVKHNDL